LSQAEPAHPEGTAAWHRRLHHTGRDRLSEETAQTPGMRRYEAISEGIVVNLPSLRAAVPELDRMIDECSRRERR
jgi:hypothetical protein